MKLSCHIFSMHLLQVAVYGDVHVKVSKEECDDGRMRTRAVQLSSLSERVSLLSLALHIFVVITGMRDCMP